MEAEGRDLVWPPHAGNHNHHHRDEPRQPAMSPMQHDGVSSSDNALGAPSEIRRRVHRAPEPEGDNEPESTVGDNEVVVSDSDQDSSDNEAIAVPISIMPDSSLANPVACIIAVETAPGADQSELNEPPELIELPTTQLDTSLNPIVQIIQAEGRGALVSVQSVRPEDVPGPSGLNMGPGSSSKASRPERRASRGVHQLLGDPDEEEEPVIPEDRDPVDEEEFLRQGAIQRITDKPITSRARASLPIILQIFKVENDQIGVFAKRNIPRRTQFGPLEGRIVRENELPEDHMKWRVKRNSEDKYIDCSDEFESNWMSFIRPASCYSEQNLIAFQLNGNEIYFATIKNIPPRTELRVWYAKTYAQMIGERILEITPEEAAELQEKENTWPCFECTRKFRSSELLQKHLATHDAPVLKNKASRGRGKRGRPRKYPEGYRQRQRKLAQAKLASVKPDQKEEYNCPFCDKKFPRLYGLQRHSVMHSGEKKFHCEVCNKTFAHYYNRTRHMRKHKERGEFSGPLPPLRKRKTGLPEGMEPSSTFSCEHCDLEFENKRMLKLHVSLHYDGVEVTEEDEEDDDEEMEEGEAEEEVEEAEEDDDEEENSDEGMVEEEEAETEHAKKMKFEVETRKEDNAESQQDDSVDDQGNRSSSNDPAPPQIKTEVDTAAEGEDSSDDDEDAENRVVIKREGFTCPTCTEIFPSQKELALHATDHGRRQGSSGDFVLRSRTRPSFRCKECFKVFRIKIRYDRHMALHHREDRKTVQCEHCRKCFLNNSALAVHLKTHSEQKYYTCPFCDENFDRNEQLKVHVQSHAYNGAYHCPHCGKSFREFTTVRKHIRGFHSLKEYPCPHCHKIFPRPDKLKLHMLRHSDQKDFLCANCGKQFKRKDKLKEHTARMHNPEREARNKFLASKPKKEPFKPKIAPSEMNAFTFKCRKCELGFKRRGMLVNHLAKRHPDVAPDTVPELNLPIVKPNRNYFCAYCEKVYKSSSKRKIHILKNHPGSNVPPSLRKTKGDPNSPFGNPHTAPAGTITTHYFACAHCPRQYSTKAKMMDHVRKKHMEPVQAAAMLNNPQQQQLTVVQEQQQVAQEDQLSGPITVMTQVPEGIQQAVQEAMAQNQTQLQHSDLQNIQIATVNPDGTTTLQPILQHLGGQMLSGPTTLQVVVAPQGQNDGASGSTDGQSNVRYIEAQVPVQTESVQAADLLTQAMSELSQTISEFRHQPIQDYQNLAQRIIHSQPGLLGQQTFQITGPGQPQTITIPVSQIQGSIQGPQITMSQSQIPQMTVTQAALAVSQAAMGISHPVGQVATTVSSSQQNTGEASQVEAGPQTIDVSQLRQSPTQFQQATQLLQLQSSAQNVIPISSIIQAQGGNQQQQQQQQHLQLQPGQVEIQVQNQQGQTQQVFVTRNWNNYQQNFR